MTELESDREFEKLVNDVVIKYNSRLNSLTNNEAQTKYLLIEPIFENFFGFNRDRDVEKEFSCPSGDNGKIDYKLKLKDGKNFIAIEAKAANVELSRFRNQIDGYSRSRELDNCNVLVLTNGIEWHIFVRTKHQKHFDFNDCIKIDLKKGKNLEGLRLLNKEQFDVEKIKNYKEEVKFKEKCDEFLKSCFCVQYLNQNNIKGLLKTIGVGTRTANGFELWKDYLDNCDFLNNGKQQQIAKANGRQELKDQYKKDKNNTDIKGRQEIVNKYRKVVNGRKQYDYIAFFNDFNLWGKKFYYSLNKDLYATLIKTSDDKYVFKYQGMEYAGSHLIKEFYEKTNGYKSKFGFQCSSYLIPEGFNKVFKTLVEDIENIDKYRV